jgi:hypothetical protein
VNIWGSEDPPTSEKEVAGHRSGWMPFRLATWVGVRVGRVGRVAVAAVPVGCRGWPFGLARGLAAWAIAEAAVQVGYRGWLLGWASELARLGLAHVGCSVQVGRQGGLGRRPDRPARGWRPGLDAWVSLGWIGSGGSRRNRRCERRRDQPVGFFSSGLAASGLAASAFLSSGSFFSILALRSRSSV